jgi:hypothetical protein
MKMIQVNKSFSKQNKPKFFTLHSSLFTLLTVLLLAGCGYKPSSHAIKNVFAETVSVNVNVDRAEPENAPYIKDEIIRMVHTRFHGRVAPKAEAQSHLNVSYNGSTFTALSYENGYVTRYRVTVKVRFDMVTKKGKEHKVITAVHEADIKASSLQSSTLKSEAISQGVKKALDEFLAYVSAKGMQSEKAKH